MLDVKKSGGDSVCQAKTEGHVSSPEVHVQKHFRSSPNFTLDIHMRKREYHVTFLISWHLMGRPMDAERRRMLPSSNAELMIELP